MTGRREVLLALGAAALCISHSPLVLALARVRRIGVLTGANAKGYAPLLAAFRAGMAELRWGDGRDYVIEARYADGDSKALDGLAAELARWKPEVMITAAEASIPAIARAMKSVPVVMAVGADPVGNGFAASLQRPGGNVTGLTSLYTELGAKRLELLKEAFPRISHVAVLTDGAVVAIASSQLKVVEGAAARLKLRFTGIVLRQAADIEPGFRQAAVQGCNAFIVATGPLLSARSAAIVEGIARAKVPAIFGQSQSVDEGGLMAYSASLTDSYRRAAAYVDKILKGAKPGDLPIEQPTKFELVINMKTAKSMGLTIPQSLLLRADRVIE